MMGIASVFVSFFSGEWILTRCGKSNGGTVIVLRSLWTSFWIMAVLVLGYSIQIGSVSNIFNWDLIKSKIVDGLKVFATITAFVYVALYARFASQWRYLADLYNKIKEAEIKSCTPDEGFDIESPNPKRSDPINEWKAGFIEDADELHLATKKIFMSILYNWLDDPGVKYQFINNTPCGEEHYAHLRRRVRVAYKKHEKELRGKFKMKWCDSRSQA